VLKLFQKVQYDIDQGFFFGSQTSGGGDQTSPTEFARVWEVMEVCTGHLRTEVAPTNHEPAHHYI